MTIKKQILVLGSLNMDLVVSVKRFPDKGETVFGNNFATFPGGKGANQAAAAGKLGGSVYMAGCVGRDAFGRQLVDSLKVNRVNTEYVDSIDMSTGTALITVDEHGTNTIVVVAGANGAYSQVQAEKVLKTFSQPGILLLQNEIPKDVVEYAIKAAKKDGWTIIYNPAPARELGAEFISLVDIMMPNETELAVLTGQSIDSPEAAMKAAAKLVADGVKAVIVTMGAKGAICCTGSERYHVEPYKVEAVDTTAAGDAYAGALAVGLAEGMPLSAGMKFASAAAALSVRKKGAQPSLPWRDEVEEFISKEDVK